MKILITGALGFVGKHLIKFAFNYFKDFNDGKVEIFGLDISEHKIHNQHNQKDNQEKIVGKDNIIINNNNKLSFYNIDLRDNDLTNSIIKEIKPNIIFHLAAQSSVKYSWDNPIETIETNVCGSINLFEAVYKYCPNCKILSACTAEEYSSGYCLKEDFALNEDSKIFPLNPYAISKAALDFFSATYHKAKNLFIFVSRSFNHIGPGQSETFVASDFAKQIAQIEKKKAEPVINVGNLNVYRDFLDVRDVVKAYCYIISKGVPGQAYNVCSGKKVKIEDILNILISLSTYKKIKINVDKNRLRPIDTFSVYGDNSKLIKHTGWYQEYDLNKSLLDTLNWWRERSI